MSTTTGSVDLKGLWPALLTPVTSEGKVNEKELEKITSDHVAKVDELLKHKEVELLEI